LDLIKGLKINLHANLPTFMAAKGFIVVVKISADMVRRAVPSAIADTCIGVMLTVLMFGQQHQSSVDPSADEM